MNSENPLCRAWTMINGDVIDESSDPRIVAKALLHDSNFGPGKLGTPLFVECLTEVESGGADLYSQEVVEGMGYLAELHFHGNGD